LKPVAFVRILDCEFYSYEKVLSTCNDLNLVHELRVGALDKDRWLILNVEKVPNCLNYVSLRCAETYGSACQGCLDFYQKNRLEQPRFQDTESNTVAVWTATKSC
jgi:hypothetical protein